MEYVENVITFRKVDRSVLVLSHLSPFYIVF